MAAVGRALPFLDSNVVLYLLSADAAKADRAEALLAAGAQVNVQVLNEVANVARRKAGLSWAEIADVTTLLRRRCKVRALTVAEHALALDLADRFSLAWYDALIVAAAAEAGSTVLYSEGMQHGLRVTPTLQICNPFVT